MANAVQANLLSATSQEQGAVNQVYNVAVGGRTTLNELYGMLRDILRPLCANLQDRAPVYREFRAGELRHSSADIGKAKRTLGYSPTHTIGEGFKPLWAGTFRKVASF